ncbi:regulatory signaling modulator protein AmpE [Parathalassolituus penaei]|uniref:Regulatory signaling modulator protein AmpE n=1 Tax=Parathalassolituus penaei TaxID=2997323 RepID=A0A9X3EBS7_9GAMM|nr:regulatory signaling modulator protein AmpE [Parathalassolituus penaei]MCY0964290.1 regulatory signaling modulator protein AmpE [Parathalassolituus penaei]
MKFLVLFLAVLLHYQLPHKTSVRRFRSFEGWLARVHRLPVVANSSADLRFGLVVVLPVLAFALVFWFVESLAWGLPAAALEVVLLYLILSELAMSDALDQYREALLKGDVQGAFLIAEKSLAVPALGMSNDARTMNESVMRAVLFRWFQYFFMMVFWYMVADVAGVVLAWLTLQYAHTRAEGKQDYSNPRAAWYLHWLEWAPVRVLGLTYCLAGNMLSALPVWRASLWNTGSSSEQVLTDIAGAALSFAPGQREWHSAEDDVGAAAMELEEWHQLHWRSLSVWMVWLAVATIGGWML